MAGGVGSACGFQRYLRYLNVQCPVQVAAVASSSSVAAGASEAPGG